MLQISMFLLTKCSALVCSLHLTTLTGASIGREFTIETETNTGRMSGEIADLDPGAERNNVTTTGLEHVSTIPHVQESAV